MNEFIELQKKLFPNMLEVMKLRYKILSAIDFLQPIGRRGLADNTNLTERTVRSEVEFLHSKGFIETTTKGMYLAKEGKVTLEQLAIFMRELTGLSNLEKQLKDTLNITRVVVVPGDSDRDEWVKQEMGKACVAYLKTIVSSPCTFAITGGTTLKAVGDVMLPFEKEGDYLFVPARGGIGEKAEIQANAIVAEMAKKTKGTYRLLYVPDHLSESAYKSITKEPSISEVLKQIKSADIMLHGVGDALNMAERRKTPDEIKKDLIKYNAVSEAFGYYFDQEGQVVHKIKTVGVQLEDLSSMEHVITIAGGTSKGKAIQSYFKRGKSDLLVTDEAAAEEILRGVSH